MNIPFIIHRKKEDIKIDFSPIALCEPNKTYEAHHSHPIYFKLVGSLLKKNIYIFYFIWCVRTRFGTRPNYVGGHYYVYFFHEIG